MDNDQGALATSCARILDYERVLAAYKDAKIDAMTHKLIDLVWATAKIPLTWLGLVGPAAADSLDVGGPPVVEAMGDPIEEGGRRIKGV